MEELTKYRLLETDVHPVKAWVEGVAFDANTEQQLRNTASMPFVFKWVAAMPDVHLGIGATVGSVVPTRGAIIPAAVGVDIGCGMCAVQTTLKASDLPENLKEVRTKIEKAVPHGRTVGRRARREGHRRDKGAWGEAPRRVANVWRDLEDRFDEICSKHRAIAKTNNINHLGTLGTGNHFIEVCLDEDQNVWLMLHSGSRGVGNRIGTYFIEKARREAERLDRRLPDKDLAWFDEGSVLFEDYMEAVGWAQNFAMKNRQIMMENVIKAIAASRGIPPFRSNLMAVNCHHNYVAREVHYGESVFVTRKGAVRAGKGELGIIPGSMGARSFIVRGLGNLESFESCSHGAGRAMSRTEAKARFTLDDHIAATEGVECRKDESVIDETPMAYKDIDAVMAAQSDLVEIVHTLKQVVCVKG